MVNEDWSAAAERAFRAGDLRACVDHARRGLAGRPDDAPLLRLAGTAALQLDLPDAQSVLRRLVEVAPDDAGAWRDLGLALTSDGRLADASEALGRAVRLDPHDAAALTSLAHVTYALGDREEAAELLSRATAHPTADAGALRNLVEMHRLAGRTRAALDAAEELARRHPGDLVAALERADLLMDVDEFDAAMPAWERVRVLDGDSGHEVYAHHALIEAEVRRERWRRALDRAIAATAVDRHQLTTDLLAFIAAQLFGAAERPAPALGDLRARLAAERADHRRLHAEALVP